MTSITLVEYDPAWPARFEEERSRILGVAGAYIEDVQHVGSTSVPGLGAKPVIDILIGLRDISLVEQCVEPLQALGYEYLGENGIPERHFFRNPAGPVVGWSQVQCSHGSNRGLRVAKAHRISRLPAHASR